MEFYFSAASTLDKLDAKQGSIKGVIANLPEKNRKRTAALVIETLKCTINTTSVKAVNQLMNRQECSIRDHICLRPPKDRAQKADVAKLNASTCARLAICKGYPSR